MRKSVLTLIILILLVVFSGITSNFVQAAINGNSTLTSFMNSNYFTDWEKDYFRALEPGKLETGDYRFSAIIGQSKVENENILGNKYEADPLAFMSNFDLALENRNYLNFYQMYVPEYKTIPDKDKYKQSTYDLSFTHVLKNENHLFAGYLLDMSENIEYNDSTNSYDEPMKNKTQLFYFGTEIRGNFPFLKSK